MEELDVVDVSFTKLELNYIDDNLTPEIVDTSQTNRPQFSSGAIGTTRAFISMIGNSIIDLEENKSDDIFVSLTAGNLWTLRELAISSVVVGSEWVGLNIKIKIYQAFRELASLDVLKDFTFVSEDDIPNINVTEKLKAFEESQDAGTDTN